MLRGAFQIFLTFHLVTLGWLFFRASSMDQAVKILGIMFSRWHLEGYDLSLLTYTVLHSFPLLVLEIWIYKRRDPFALLSANPFLRALVYAAMLLLVLYFGPTARQEFIYFQF